jgi:hypothetical protein
MRCVSTLELVCRHSGTNASALSPILHAVCNLCCGKHSCPLHPSEAADAEKCICEICTCLFHHCPVHSGPIAKGDTTHRIHYPEHPVQPRVPFARDDPLGDGVPFLGRTTYESHFPGHAVRAKEKTDIPLPTVAPNAVPLSTEHRDGYLRPESRAPNQGRVHVSESALFRCWLSLKPQP